MKQYLSTQSVAEFLDVSKSYVEKHWVEWVTKFNIRTYKQGKLRRFNRDDIERMMNKFLVACVLCFVSLNAYAIDLNKIKQIESSGNPYAVSSQGCRGLYQISAITLKEWNNFHPKETYTAPDLFNPKVNLKIAKWYLHVRIPQMLRYYKKEVNTRNILVAYNAGINYVVKDLPLPTQTVNYLKKYGN